MANSPVLIRQEEKYEMNQVFHQDGENEFFVFLCYIFKDMNF